MMSPLPFVAVLLPLLGGVVQAQAAPDRQQPIVNALSAVGLNRVDGALRADGPTYKAMFDTAGLRFVPAFGGRVHAPQTLHLQLQGIARGEHAVAIATAVVPEQAGGLTVRYARSATVAEQFDVRSEGVELSVHFARPLPGDGDLVVRYRFESPMQPPVAGESAADGGIAFAVPGVGRVAIGAVTGIDAKGERVRGSLCVQGDLLELRLPDAFVDQAAWPLVLDPLVGAQFDAVNSAATNETAADVCATGIPSAEWIVASRRWFAATDADLVVSRITSGGVPNGGVFPVEAGAPLSGPPTIAWLRGRDRAVIAWGQQNSLFEQSDIHTATYEPLTNQVQTFASIVGASANDIAPELAGDNELRTQALLAWQRTGAGLRAMVLTVDGTGAVSTSIAFQVTTEPTAAAPAFSKSHAGGEWRVLTWRQRPANWEIRAMAMDPLWNVSSAPVVVDSSSTELANPDVDGRGNQFVVGWERFEAGGTRDVVIRGYTFDGANLQPASAATTLTAALTDESMPAVGFAGKFVVAYAAAFPLSSNTDIRAVEVTRACVPCGTGFALQGLNTTLGRNIETAPVVASRCSAEFDSTSRSALIVFAELEDLPPFRGSLVAQRYVADGAGGPVNVVGTSCGAGTIGSSNGGFAVANTDFRITLTGAPVGAVPFLLIGLPGGETACGTCTVSNFVSATFVAISGSGSTPYPLPCSTYPFVGLTLQMQWAVLGAPTSPCPLATGLAFSERLQLTLGL